MAQSDGAVPLALSGAALQQSGSEPGASRSAPLPHAPCSSSSMSSHSSSSSQSRRPQRELRQRSSISAHRPRPTLTSSARGIAKLEMRRQKEREANEAYTQANAVVLEQEHSGRSSAAQRISTSPSLSENALAMDTRSSELSDAGPAPHRPTASSLPSPLADADERAAHAAETGSSQSDFFASPRRTAQGQSSTTQEGTSQTRADAVADECIEEQTMPGSGVAVRPETHEDRCATPPQARSRQEESERVHTVDAEASTFNATDVGTEPPKKKLRTFVEPGDEFDDEDDDGFFEALAETDFDWGGERGSAVPTKTDCHSKKGQDGKEKAGGDNGFQIIMFKKANQKPISLDSPAHIAHMRRFCQEMDNSHHDDNSTIVKKEDDRNVFDRNFERNADEAHVTPPLAAERHVSPRLPQCSEVEAGSWVDQSSPVLALARPTLPKDSTVLPFADKTNLHARHNFVGEAQSPFKSPKRPVEELMPSSTPLRSAQTANLFQRPSTPSLVRTQTPSTPVRRGQSSKRLGAGRLATPRPVTSLAVGSAARANSQMIRPGRVSLGSTPRRSANSTPQFKPPFKNEAAARAQLERGLYVASPQPHLQSGRGTTVQGRSLPQGSPVFNLEALPERKCLADVISTPETTTKDETRNWLGDACEDVSCILSQPNLARRFAFPIGEHGSASVEEARAHLAEASGVDPSRIPLKWVRNHYGLIVWKLAALVRHIASADTLWSFEEVCRQLLYRYEREINHSHRSAVKRIQERDSAVGRLMQLCVFGMEDANTDTITLTDGWYCIKAHVDEPLQRAIKNGHIKLGSKVMIKRATLVGEPEAADPLEALDSTFLKINGNACKLARWDTRLGFATAMPVAAARSLTADGGLVPCMDVVASKVFPTAYVEYAPRSTDPTAHTPHEAPWGQEEEDARRQAWTRKREDVMQDMEKNTDEETRKLENIVEMLESAYSDALSGGCFMNHGEFGGGKTLRFWCATPC